MGIMSRCKGTISALFSSRLWTDDGLATEAGKNTFWDRSTLYGLRGALIAGEIEQTLKYFRNYTRRRLLGEHVPYAVEAWPEGEQRHLSAESALYCRVVTEGLFGIVPTGLNRFLCSPRLPADWERMSLKSVRAFGCNFDLTVMRQHQKVKVIVEIAGKIIFERAIKSGDSLSIQLLES